MEGLLTLLFTCIEVCYLTFFTALSGSLKLSLVPLGSSYNLNEYLAGLLCVCELLICGLPVRFEPPSSICFEWRVLLDQPDSQGMWEKREGGQDVREIGGEFQSLENYVCE